MLIPEFAMLMLNLIVFLPLFLKIYNVFLFAFKFLCHNFMRKHCNSIDLLFTVGSPCDVIFIIITIFGCKHV